MNRVVRITVFGVVTLFALATANPMVGQETQPSTLFSARLLYESEIGTEANLGYKLPSTAFGLLVEQPLGKRFELQSRVSYSPDKKVITDNGNSFLVSGTGIVWATSRVGLSGAYGYSWLWTSQFDKNGWAPSAGTVIRNSLFGPGRIYVSYIFPTGCVWATPSNPCKIQSNRLQGIDVTPEVQISSHIRVGLNVGLYHFCDQSNQNDPAVPRQCHLGGTELLVVRLNLPGGRFGGHPGEY
jgi:hypothetical protein